METTGIIGIILVSWPSGIVTFHDDLPNYKFNHKASSRWLLSPMGLQVLRGLPRLHDGFCLYHHFGVVGKPLEGHSR